MIMLIVMLFYYILIWPFIILVKLCLLPFKLMLQIVLLPFRALDGLFSLPGRLLSSKQCSISDGGDTMDSFLDFVEEYECLTDDEW